MTPDLVVTIPTSEALTTGNGLCLITLASENTLMNLTLRDIVVVRAIAVGCGCRFWIPPKTHLPTTAQKTNYERR